MTDSDMTVRIAGENGEGVLSVGETLAEGLARNGLCIYTFKNLPAEIKGGPSMIQVRFGSRPIHSPGDALDVLMAWNQENYDIHIGDLCDGGAVLYDPSECEPGPDLQVTHIPAPLQQIIREEIKVVKSKNVLALGILAAYIGIPYELALSMVQQSRWGRRKEFLESNLQAVRAGYRHIDTQGTRYHNGITFPEEATDRRMILTGNEALSLGAIAAGCRYYAGYPITPASDIMEALAKHLPKFGGVVVQTEDEIAALASVIGASYAGTRAMTATSGPGFSLMVEELGLATMYEVPIVVVDVQRGGPSTGLPTKTEQSDLDLAVYGRHGDSPRIVMAVRDVEDCFRTTIRAFNLAEAYQTPVILLSDAHIAHRSEAIPRPDVGGIKILDRLSLPGGDTGGEYGRYSVTESGVSPMVFPGIHDHPYVATGLEHDEHAHISYDPLTHAAMNDKRARKIRASALEDGLTLRHGPGDARFGLIAWGCTTGAVLEALERANADGLRVAACFPSMIHPVPDAEIGSFLASVKDVAVAELNHSGQYANLLQAHYCRPFRRLNKTTGLPFRACEILDFIRHTWGK